MEREPGAALFAVQDWTNAAADLPHGNEAPRETSWKAALNLESRSLSRNQGAVSLYADGDHGTVLHMSSFLQMACENHAQNYRDTVRKAAVEL